MGMKARKQVLCFIVILSMIASLVIKSGLGATGTYYPTDTEDDGFITQIGNHFVDTPYLPLRSATTDVIDGLRFRTLNIPQDAKINNATLFVRTLHTYDPGVVQVTIYGVAENDAYAFTSSGDFTRAFTSNYVNWNVTEVNGYAWHNVSVTNIVQEIISRYGWRSGNSLAFIILADSGEPRREFASIDNYVAWIPRLEITWDVAPPTPPSSQADPPYNDTSQYTWTLNATYRGFDIWNATTEGVWLDYSSFTVTNPTGNIGTVYPTNFTYTTFFEDDNDYLRKAFDDNGTIRRKFGVNYIDFDDYSGLEGSYILTHWGISNSTGPSTLWTDGYSLSTYQDSGGVKEHMRILAWQGGSIRHFIILHPFYTVAQLPITLYYDVQINTITGKYTVILYHDIEMTIVNNTVSGTFANFVSADMLDTEFAIAPFYVNRGSDADSETGVKLSRDDFDADTVTFISYPNGTLVTPDPLPPDVDPYDYIDDLLGGADPEDPETDEYGEALTKNRWKTFVFVIGMLMFLGTPTFAMMARVSTG